MREDFIFSFANLFTIRAHLFGAGYTVLEDVFSGDPDDSHAVEDTIRRVGNLGLARAALNSAVRDRASCPKIHGYPPTIFISYRWEDAEMKEWTWQLARHLERRGYRIYLDQDVQRDTGSNPIYIGRYVALIVDCDVIVTVATPQYIAGIMRRTWLFEERQLANLAIRRGTTAITILKDGQTGIPSQETWDSFFARGADKGIAVEIPVPETLGTVVDMRGPHANDYTVLNDSIRDYTGLRLPTDSGRRLAEWVASFRQVYEAGNMPDAEEVLHAGEGFAATAEYRQMAAHMLCASGSLNEGANLALEVMQSATTSAETKLDLCSLLQGIGANKAAIAGFASLPRLGEEWQWRVNFALGDILDDLGSHAAACAHLSRALQLAQAAWIEPRPKPGEFSTIHNTLGYLLFFHLGDAVAALPHFEKAVELSPEDRGAAVNLILCYAALGDYSSARRLWTRARLEAHATEYPGLKEALDAENLRTRAPEVVNPSADAPRLDCPDCKACLSLSGRPFLCMTCASVHEDPSDCPYCGGTRSAVVGLLGSELPSLTLCPICRSALMRVVSTS